MKKKYILLPLACIAVLIAIIVAVAIALNTGFLKKLSYDHVDQNVYNGVEIVGDNGLFYLVKDGKKISDGYASLQSVNDYYTDDLRDLAATNCAVTLFDYYIARTQDSSCYFIINSEGEKFTVLGESYSLDLESTRLPYLIFTNNTNGLKAAVSLHRLDSDISYKSGNELTLRPFKDITPYRTSADSMLFTYLVTEDISDEIGKSYFGHDGIKICAGNNIAILELYDSDDEDTVYPFFYNADTKKLLSSTGELIASDVVEIMRNGYTDWKYANCYNGQTDTAYAVVFSPKTCFTLSSQDYAVETLMDFGSCMIAERNDSGFDVINISGAKLGSYVSVTQNGCALTAENSDGSYSYLDENGLEIMSGKYGDMIALPELSSKYCTVLSSQSYNSETGTTFLHFAAAGVDLYSLDVTDVTVALASVNGKNLPCASFILTRTTDAKASQAVLSPFSTVKVSAYYDTLSLYNQNGISWILGASYVRGAYDIIDPLTSKAVISFNCSDEDFAKYQFTHEDNIALATDPRDSDTATHIIILTLSKYDSDTIKSSTKYFALYRPEAHASKEFRTAPLRVFELGTELRIDDPYTVFSAENYLITHTAAGSNVFSLDDDGELFSVATLPYIATDILTDRSDPEKKYFVVETDSGMKGVYNTESEAVISPYYTEISYAEDGNFVVGLRGAYGVIKARTEDVKTVVDFRYSYVIPLGDNGYYAVTGEGETHVFAGKSQVLSESVQSVTAVYSYSTDEDGALHVSAWTLFSVDGSLYIHRSKQELYLTFGEYVCDTTPRSALNQRAKVIYYYNGAELLHTDIIYPNDPSTDLYSNSTVDGWYISKKAHEQTEKVTTDQLNGRYVVKLYAKSN